MTNAPGVRISSRLQERYPEQMTIVIQYQYWDLKVTETGFEIGLSFSDIPEKLEIPFSAVRGFYDPSANFELEFDPKQDADGAEPAAPPAEVETLKSPRASKKQDAAAGKPAEKKEKAKAGKDDKPATEGGKGAEVVSLDAFRKK
jgi:hypothetical protein